MSAIQLRRRDFVATVEEALKHGAVPAGIDLEITESLIMEDVQGNIEKLKALRALGVSVAIDDFGTGYSSLGYLAKLPVQALKIDRSFIITMLDDAKAMTLVATIISLAHSLQAEGDRRGRGDGRPGKDPAPAALRRDAGLPVQPAGSLRRPDRPAAQARLRPGYSTVLARRNPVRLSRLSAAFLLRAAERAKRGTVLQEPPRLTRCAQSPASQAEPSAGAPA